MVNCHNFVQFLELNSTLEEKKSKNLGWTYFCSGIFWPLSKPTNAAETSQYCQLYWKINIKRLVNSRKKVQKSSPWQLAVLATSKSNKFFRKIVPIWQHFLKLIVFRKISKIGRKSNHNVQHLFDKKIVAKLCKLW